MAVAKAEAATKVIDATAAAYEELNKQCGINPQNNLDEFIYLAEL